ncbi:MAG TPA: histidine kinase [Flavisolibacter sp.]|nr:histidine kinase [Flavisolibacter sp.]
MLSLTKDQSHYLWVATRRGLVRFDGRNFSNYTPKDSLSIRNPYSIIQDKKLRMWIAAKDRIYKLEGNHANEYFPSTGGKQADSIFSILESSQYGIMACTNLGMFSFRNEQWERIHLPALSNQIITHILETEEGTYLSSRKQILFLNKQGNLSVCSVLDTTFGSYGILKQFKSTILVRSDSGLCCIQDKKVLPLLTGRFRKDRVFDFLIDKQDRLWVVLNLNNVWVSKTHHYSELIDKINVPPFSRRLLESDDAIWICNYLGLFKVKEFPKIVYEMPQLSNISMLTKDPTDSSILAISPTHGIFRYSEGNFKSSGDLKFPLRKQIGIDHFYRTATDNDKGLWMISVSGTYFYRLAKHQFKSFRISAFTEPLALEFDPFRNKVLLAASQLYMGDLSGFEPYPYSNRKNPLSHIYSVLSIGKKLIVSSRSEGAGMIDETNHYHSWNKELHLTGFHQQYEKVLFYRENDSIFWTAHADYGISKYVFSNNKLTLLLNLPAGQGFDGTATSLLMDKQGRLWVASETGLSIFEWSNGSSKPVFWRIDKILDLNIQNWELTTLRQDKAGAIWMNNFDRIYQIDASHLQLKKQAPPTITIDAIEINSEIREWNLPDTAFHGFYRIPYKVTLPYLQNNITIHFNGVSFAGDGELTYAWSLDGRMKTWQQTQSNTVSFGDLAPGTYHFSVKARTSNTAWSQTVPFTFTITPPFWDTAWFHLALSILGAVIVALIYRFHLRRVTRKAQEENRLQRLEMKALKAQMNPHFIYNALNSIQSLVLDNNQKDSLKYISKFSRLLRQTLDSSDTHIVPLSKDLELLELYIQLESLRMNFNFTYKITVLDDMDPEKEMIPPLLIQPYVENALWHGLSEKAGEKLLQLTLYTEGSFIVCKVRDNGIGRKRSAELKSLSASTHTSKGMNITGKRLELHNGRSDKSIQINDLYDASSQPAGTEVQLLIKRNLPSDETN